MDAVLIESNPEVFNLEDEITKNTQLFRRLSEAEEHLIQRQTIIEEECNRLSKEIYSNKHRKLVELILDTKEAIRLFEEFPINTYYTDPVRAPLPRPTAKELAEIIQRTKIQFHHKNKNLTNERKMVRELRQKEKERQKQLQVQAKEANEQSDIRPNPCYTIRRYPIPLPQTPIRSLIMMWAEKIEFVSSLVLHDSKKPAPTWRAYLHLEDLRKTSAKLFRSQNVDKAKFAKEWESMKRRRNSFSQIKFDLAKEFRRHIEGYAEFKRVEEKQEELWKGLWEEVCTELRDLQPRKRAVQWYLVKLQMKQSEVQSCLP